MGWFSFLKPKAKNADTLADEAIALTEKAKTLVDRAEKQQQEARSYLLLAQTAVIEAMKERDGDNRLAHLHQASRALEHVRRLDPKATIIFEEATATHDSVAGELAYFESRLHYARGDAAMDAAEDYLMSNSNPTNVQDYHKVAFEHYARALEPARKAVTYRPNTPMYLRHLSLVYRANDKPKEAKKYLDAAYQLDPTDIETLKLMT